MNRRLLMMVLSVLSFGAGLSAAQEEGEGGGAAVGPGKAVTAADAKDGLRLSEAAIKRLGVAFQDVKHGGPQELPPQSLVASREESSVYRLRGGWIKRVEVRVHARSARLVKIESKEIQAGDRIVIAGAPFLRIAELDALGSEKEEADER